MTAPLPACKAGMAEWSGDQHLSHTELNHCLLCFTLRALIS